MTASANSSVKKKFNWLGAFAWGAGSAIFGWLLAGILFGRDYRNLGTEAIVWMIVLGFDAIVIVFLFYIRYSKKNKSSVGDSPGKDSVGEDSTDTFSRVLSALLPALYLVLALATLVLTLSTYNGDWTEARQGLATGFAALLAAVGAIISVYVTYKSGEENRKAQQENLKQQLNHQAENLEKQLKHQAENLEKQLEHQAENLEKQLEQQRVIEDSKDKREQNKQDSETIKSLNDRLHNIIPRRNSEDEKERISSYFQLAALYKDWDLLAENSEKIDKQRANQQKYILKILFGTAKKDNNGNFIKVRTTGEDRVINAIISDIFIDAGFDNNAENNLSAIDKNSDFKGYELEYVDISYLDFSGKLLANSNFSHALSIKAEFQDAFLDGANFSHAFLDGANFSHAFLDGAKFEDASLQGADFERTSLQGADFERTSLQGAKFKDAYLRGAKFKDASLQGADFWNAFLQRAEFWKASLQEAKFEDASLQEANFIGAKLFGENQNQKDMLKSLSGALTLPDDESLLGVKGFTKELLDELKVLHELQTKIRWNL